MARKFWKKCTTASLMGKRDPSHLILRFYWMGITKNVEERCQACEACCAEMEPSEASPCPFTAVPGRKPNGKGLLTMIQRGICRHSRCLGVICFCRWTYWQEGLPTCAFLDGYRNDWTGYTTKFVVLWKCLGAPRSAATMWRQATLTSSRETRCDSTTYGGRRSIVKATELLERLLYCRVTLKSSFTWPAGSTKERQPNPKLSTSTECGDTTGWEATLGITM